MCTDGRLYFGSSKARFIMVSFFLQLELDGMVMAKHLVGDSYRYSGPLPHHSYNGDCIYRPGTQCSPTDILQHCTFPFDRRGFDAGVSE